MPMPMEYRHASEQFDAFMEAARERSGLTTRNQTYTMVQGVLQVFRSRLTVSEAIAFAQALPAVLRAIFVSEWDMSRAIKPFGSRADMTHEVKALRRDHNFSPDTSIADVAFALRQSVDPVAFQRALNQLAPEASAYWAV
ncbi:DUF2267 domain-containing protein [Rhizobium oryziradicis]|uniref:DUF2267 domain-containing protein n=1 Tax=Rhizobium oryziradicis TaxID=1867956 RepID=A0A1Q8ZPL9_9HYPH|nr:DUF2267 domain-containing protein [Rhizobium oryziradicis]OLP43716.1 hypothetical protein BJF95_23045 [Rhizobium oryziradicis]